jgi:Dolichyl-phosphate-mannose-protein mannosyltransferase
MSTIDRPDPSTATASQLSRILPILAAGLVLLGIGVRLRHYLAAPSYWYDEAYLLLNVFEKNCVELMGPLRAAQAGPPVFLWVLRLLYLIAGPSEWVMRLPAFIASLLAVVVMIPLARRVVWGPGWLWAVGLCALSMHGVNHGIEVKPYAWDLLATLLLLLAAAQYFASADSRRFAWMVLLILAIAAPWCSLPSVFVLGGLSAALLFDCWRRPTKGRLAVWLLFNITWLLSCIALWHSVLRYQRSQVLQVYWSEFFGDTSSVPGFLGWSISCLVGIGNYGSNGLGVVLVVLAILGAFLLGRRSGAMTVLLTVPFFLAMTASLLRLYPLADRLSFFLVPCVWLLVAETIGKVAEWWCRLGRGRLTAWVGLASLLLLLAPGTGQLCKKLFVVVPRLSFRDAFDYVDQRRRPQDVCWVSHPEVLEVYRGKVAWGLNAFLPLPELVHQAQGHRIWLVCAVGPNGPQQLPELEARLRQAGMKPLAEQDFPDLLVRLYGPPSSVPDSK